MSTPSHSVISENTPTFYVGRRRQVGYGFGSIFRSLYRAAIPLFKSEILPRASNLASDIARDVLSGHDLPSALRTQGLKHGEQALTDIFQSIGRQSRRANASTQTGSGLRRIMNARINNGSTYPFAPIVIEDTTQTVRRTQRRRRNTGAKRKVTSAKRAVTRRRQRPRTTRTRRTVKRRTVKRTIYRRPRGRRQQQLDALTNI